MSQMFQISRSGQIILHMLLATNTEWQAIVLHYVSGFWILSRESAQNIESFECASNDVYKFTYFFVL